MNRLAMLVLVLLAFALPSQGWAQSAAQGTSQGASAQGTKCGAYSYAGAGAWAAARGYPDCELAKQAAFAACQKRALNKPEREDCLAGPSFGTARWVEAQWCRGSEGRRGMIVSTNPEREQLSSQLRKFATDSGYDPSTCRRIVIFHSDEARKVTSGRAY